MRGPLVAETGGRQGRDCVALDGQPVAIEAFYPNADGKKVSLSIRLRFRRVNQVEAFRTAEMKQERGRRFRGAIPGNYTDTPYPLQYYFEVRALTGRAWLEPGLGSFLCGPPYYVLRQAG